MADEKKDLKELREGLEKLKQISVDELSDEELEEVAGGVEDCSSWCCSDGGSDPTEVESSISGTSA